METPSLIALGADSTASFASLSPNPVIPRTSLMTLIFFSPILVRITSNSVFSSAGAAASPVPAATGAATAAAAALTPNLSSISLTSSDISSTDMLEMNSITWSFVIFAIFPQMNVNVFLLYLHVKEGC